jgi:hypothetical protein
LPNSSLKWSSAKSEAGPARVQKEHRFAGIVSSSVAAEESGDAMSIDPSEDPPIQPGQPVEPPPESPPGNPRPEIPPPVREPGEPRAPDELPGHMPDERGPQTPPSPPAPTDF